MTFKKEKCPNCGATIGFKENHIVTIFAHRCQIISGGDFQLSLPKCTNCNKQLIEGEHVTFCRADHIYYCDECSATLEEKSL